MHKVQAELQAWMQKADPGDKATRTRHRAHAKDAGTNEREGPQALGQTADVILKLMGLSVDNAENKPPQVPPSSSSSTPDDSRKPLTEKAGIVKQGVQKWVASGRDQSTVVQEMQGEFKPLMEAGKIAEVEAELDRLLEQLNKDPK